eukprot:jgi/Mesvir1/23954/Mv10723-RA.1
MSKERKRRERKLLHAAAAGRLKKVEKYILKDTKVSKSARVKTRSKKADKLKDVKLNVNCVDWEGRTPLHLACEAGSADVVRFLIGHGAIPFAVDSKGRCPLHEAARKGHTDILSLLVASGADMEAPDEHGVTPKALLAEHDARQEEKRRQAARVHLEDDPPPLSWHDRLAEECGLFPNGDAFFGGWSCGDEAAAEHHLADDLFERLAKEMLRRRARYMDEPPRAPKQAKQRPIGPQPRAGGAASAGAHPLDDGAFHDTQRELGAEGARAREQGLASLRQRRAGYLANWERMADISATRELTYDDIAFPVPEGQEAELAAVLLVDVGPEEEKKEVKAHVVRWHPGTAGTRGWSHALRPCPCAMPLRHALAPCPCAMPLRHALAPCPCALMS